MIQVDGKTFVALRVHTSPTFENDPEGADVTRATQNGNYSHDGAEWKGNWTVATTYKAGNIVKYGPGIYKCIKGHISSHLKVPTQTDLLQTSIKWVVVA